MNRKCNHVQERGNHVETVIGKLKTINRNQKKAGNQQESEQTKKRENKYHVQEKNRKQQLNPNPPPGACKTKRLGLGCKNKETKTDTRQPS